MRSSRRAQRRAEAMSASAAEGDGERYRDGDRGEGDGGRGRNCSVSSISRSVGRSFVCYRAMIRAGGESGREQAPALLVVCCCKVGCSVGWMRMER